MLYKKDKKVEKKINNTGLRVLELLKALMEKPMSTAEIIKFLVEFEKCDNIYTRETVMKYINTFKALGFKVDKKDKQYHLMSYPLMIDFTRDNLKTLRILDCCIKNLYQDEVQKEFAQFLSMVEKCFSPKTRVIYDELKQESVILYDIFSQSIDKSVVLKFEHICKDSQKIVIKYRNDTLEKTVEYRLEPVRLRIIKNKTFLEAYNLELNEIQLFLLNNIVDVMQLPQKSSFLWSSQGVVFKLKMPLAKSYKIRESETFIAYENDEMIIQNSHEDKEQLYKRLLKYGTLCEIIKPSKYRKKFKELIENTLRRYE